MDGKIRFYSADERMGELSNFWKLGQPMKFQGVMYPTSEHAYQAQKFLFPGNTADHVEYAGVIARAKTPNQAKLLANMECGNRFPWQQEIRRTIVTFAYKGVKADPDWEGRKFSVMREVLRTKFRFDLHCRSVLLSTMDCLIEETAVHGDLFWGITRDGRGQNCLGKLLMDVRKVLFLEEECERHKMLADFNHPNPRVLVEWKDLKTPISLTYVGGTRSTYQ